jgi:drug/metabolite transporter (DMT)-like permease
MGLLFALEPVFALLFAVTLGAERFEPRWWLGAGLILGAVVMVESGGERR